jgi:hypothetical protein
MKCRGRQSMSRQMTFTAEIPGWMPGIIPPAPLLPQTQNSQRPSRSEDEVDHTTYGRRLQQETRCVLHPMFQANLRMEEGDVALRWICMKHFPRSREPSVRVGSHLMQRDLMVSMPDAGRTVLPRRTRKSSYTRHASSFCSSLITFSPGRNNYRSSLATRFPASRSNTMSRWRHSGTRISYGQTIPSTSDRCFTSPRRRLPQAGRNPSRKPREDVQTIRHSRATLHLRFIPGQSHACTGPPRTGTGMRLSIRGFRPRSMIQQRRIRYPQEARRPPSNAFHSLSSHFSRHLPLLSCHHHPSQNHWRQYISQNLATLALRRPRLLISRYEARRRLDWRTC